MRQLYKKVLIGAPIAVFFAVIVSVIGVNVKDTSALVLNYSDAVSEINARCAAGYTIAHAGYGSNPSLNMTTGVVTYGYNVLWKRCNNNPSGEYAITGYENNACPAVGKYHWDNYTETHDCIKYTDRHGEGRAIGVCGVYRCVYSGFNANVRQGGYSGPANDGVIHSRYIASRTVTVPNWSSVGRVSGSANVFLSNICGVHYGTGGIWQTIYCTGSYIHVSWTRPWSINGQSYIMLNGGARTQGEYALTATPGDVLSWDHDLRNNGPYDMGQDVTVHIDSQSHTIGGSSNPLSWTDGGSHKGNNGVLFYTNYGATRAVSQSDVGERLCRRIAWNPGSSSDSGWLTSGWACASVPYNFSLVPNVTNPSGGGNAESDQGTIAVSGSITNNGPTKSRANVDWQLTQIDYPASASIANKSGGTGATACTYFTGETSCNVLNSGTESGGFGYPNTRHYSGTGDLSNKDLGTQVCFVLSVRNYQEGASDWKHSALSCIIINKKPKVQVLGGDLWVGRGSGVSTAQVVTGRTQSSGTYYGSWSEYGIVTPTTIRGMASAAGYSGGTTGANYCTLSLLTFANTTSSGSCDANNVGGYAVATSQPIAALSSTLAPRATTSISGAQDIASLAADTVYSAGGDITLTSSADVPKGKWVVIRALGRTVTIASNIAYTNVITKAAEESSAGLIGELPQVVIIAANIVINEPVTQVDAWLAATDTVRTCSIFNVNDLGGDVCGNKLTVNGPVITDNLLLYRTAGAGKGTAAGDPAEVFNLRPDAYLWATALQNETARVKTVESKELPPRY